MSDLIHLIAFGAGAFCLGAAVICAAIFAISAHHNPDTGEGCFGKFVTFVIGCFALVCFYCAIFK